METKCGDAAVSGSKRRHDRSGRRRGPLGQCPVGRNARAADTIEKHIFRRRSAEYMSLDAFVVLARGSLNRFPVPGPVRQGAVWHAPLVGSDALERPSGRGSRNRVAKNDYSQERNSPARLAGPHKPAGNCPNFARSRLLRLRQVRLRSLPLTRMFSLLSPYPPVWFPPPRKITSAYSASHKMMAHHEIVQERILFAEPKYQI